MYLRCDDCTDLIWPLRESDDPLRVFGKSSRRLLTFWRSKGQWTRSILRPKPSHEIWKTIAFEAQNSIHIENRTQSYRGFHGSSQCQTNRWVMSPCKDTVINDLVFLYNGVVWCVMEQHSISAGAMRWSTKETASACRTLSIEYFSYDHFRKAQILLDNPAKVEKRAVFRFHHSSAVQIAAGFSDIPLLISNGSG
jgi:hypothetical protein